jgi:hypothetical protein
MLQSRDKMKTLVIYAASFVVDGLLITGVFVSLQ